MTLDGRNNSIAAAIAETFWVLSGSKVISGWLQYFLHRAPLYSDDGVTWTRAYGPMLYQNNQWAGVIKYLEANPQTRQAVLSIFDLLRNLMTLSIQSWNTAYQGQVM